VLENSSCKKKHRKGKQDTETKLLGFISHCKRNLRLQNFKVSWGLHCQGTRLLTGGHILVKDEGNSYGPGSWRKSSMKSIMDTMEGTSLIPPSIYLFHHQNRPQSTQDGRWPIRSRKRCGDTLAH